MDNSSAAGKYTRATLICSFVCGLLYATPARSENELTCIDVRPTGRLVAKRIVFEKSGTRSTDLFPLLQSFDPATGIIAAINNGRPLNIKVSDWTALHVEMVRSNPAAQVALPSETLRGSVELTVQASAVAIANGLISLVPNGCNSASANSSAEDVFFGTISFQADDGTHWKVVGNWSTFTPPSQAPWNGGIDRKPGG